LITFSLFGILINPVFSQSFEKLYMGTNYTFYLNTEIKVDLDNYSEGFYSCWFTDLRKVGTYSTNGILYPKSKGSGSTDETKLKDKIFKVIDIINVDGTKFNKNPRVDNPIFKLKDITSGDIVFFLYKTRNCTSYRGFPFTTKKNMDDYDFCSEIIKRGDEFTDEIFHTGRIKSTLGNYQIITKSVKNGVENIYLSLTVPGRTVNVMKKGVILLLDDKTKINLPGVDVECNVSSKGGYEYYSFIELTKEQIEILKVKEIDKIRLYIYDSDLNGSTSYKLKEYLNCLIE